MYPPLSVIVPAYNEARRLPPTLERLDAHFAPGEAEILVVDDGSTDQTAEVVRAAAQRRAELRLLRYPDHRGKGFAVRTGVLAARGARVLLCDADLSTPIEDRAVLESALGTGADLAIGSRALPGSVLIRRQPRHRELGGRALNWLIQLCATPGLRDTQCGFKLFDHDRCRGCFERQRLDGFGYDVEVLFLARRAGLRIAEVPVRWSDVEGTRVRPLRDGLGMVADLIRIRWWALSGGYRLSAEPAA